MDKLPDPKNDRVVKALPAPPHHPLTAANLFLPNNKIDWKLLRSTLKRQGRVGVAQFIQMLDVASWIVRNEPNVVAMAEPLTIVGDIHGQYYDFLKLLEVGGDPETSKYLFLGDYVDRGSFSIQCVLLLLALKINFPNTMVMLRGNHQSRQITSNFNFRTECLYKFNQEIYDRIMNFFDALPLCCVVNQRYFCVHGGISPELKSIQQINQINRFKEVPGSGIFCDLLWADPIDSVDGKCAGGFKPNQNRKCSYHFGYDLAKKFLETNKLISIIRAHQVQIQGYRAYKWNGPKYFPVVVTIFSAPNYCDSYNNKGAIIKLSNNDFNFQQFTYTAHPFILPNFINVFQYTMPLIASKLTQMMYFLLTPDKRYPQSYKIAIQMKDQIKFLEEIMATQKQETRKNARLIQMHGMCPDNKLIEEGAIQNIQKFYKPILDQDQAILAFENAKKIDWKNERWCGNL